MEKSVGTRVETEVCGVISSVCSVFIFFIGEIDDSVSLVDDWLEQDEFAILVLLKFEGFFFTHCLLPYFFELLESESVIESNVINQNSMLLCMLGAWIKICFMIASLQLIHVKLSICRKSIVET